MAAIHDLLKQIDDPRLRDRIEREWNAATKHKKFGLVFEQHLPELLPLYKSVPRKGDLVCRRDGPLEQTWRVRRVSGGKATCTQVKEAGEQEGAAAAVVTPLEELLVVRQFGEPIFPALTPVDAVQNGPEDAPWHTLIEADNYHALQLLEYLYAAQVDCIYIDPPYNTGARDWKYNNNYVDGNDSWRHSKWLSFMERRLRLAKRLLKPDTGVLIVTIDEHEVHHLGQLLEEQFPECARQMTTIVINQKGVSQGRLARVEEYAMFAFMPGAFLKAHHDDLLSPDRSDQKRFQVPRWEWLLRGGNNSRREDRPLLFYPIFIDPEKKRILDVGEPLPLDQVPDPATLADEGVAWPIRRDRSYGNWQVGPSSFKKLIKEGFVRLGGYDKKRQTWTVQYLNRGTRKRIENGEIIIIGRNEVSGSVQIEYANTDARLRNIKTVWHRGIHDSGIYGSSVLKNIIGDGGSFTFPKSIYSTKDAVAVVTRDRPNAIILDFFAGSGTTLNSVNLINAADDGQRRCILVTNNEVAAEEISTLRAKGLQPGDEAWEAQGICRSVTWPRSKYSILGLRDDGTLLTSEYLTGRTVERETARKFIQIGFVTAEELVAPPKDEKKKQLVNMIDGLPQTLVANDCRFIVSENHKASVLFDPVAAEDWLSALNEQDHITDFYIVTPTNSVFNSLKAQVTELLGPQLIREDEKRPMADGFAANLAYFKLNFLDKERVELRQAFREILPLLWLKAGATGARPELPIDAIDPPFFVPETTNFVVLLEEARIRKFLTALEGRKGLSHVFIVTDAEESFRALADEVRDALLDDNPGLQLVQLYRDYLVNFMINRRQEDAADTSDGIAS